MRVGSKGSGRGRGRVRVRGRGRAHSSAADDGGAYDDVEVRGAIDR